MRASRAQPTWRTCATLGIAADPVFGNQPTITWPGFPKQFVLETTVSLGNTNWSVAPEVPIGTTNGVAVPLAPTDTERFFRLRLP